MSCCDEYLELISAAIDGALSPEETEKLNAHLARCPECRALCEELSAVHAALSDLPPVEVPADLRDRVMAAVAAEKVVPFAPAEKKRSPVRWQRWLASAAVLAVVLAGAWGLKPWEYRFDDRKPQSAELQKSVSGTTGSGVAAGAPEASMAPDAAAPEAAPASDSFAGDLPAPANALPCPAEAPVENAGAAAAKISSPAEAKEKVPEAPISDPPAQAADDPSQLQAVSPTALEPEEQSPVLFSDTSLPLPSQAPEETAPATPEETPSPMVRSFLAPASSQYAPYPGENSLPEQNVASQTQAVDVLVNYIYEFVGEVELVEDGLAMNYTVNSPTGISGTVACVGENEEVYFLNYRDDLSSEVLNYSVRKDSGAVTLLGSEPPAVMDAAP